MYFQICPFITFKKHVYKYTKAFECIWAKAFFVLNALNFLSAPNSQAHYCPQPRQLKCAFLTWSFRPQSTFSSGLNFNQHFYPVRLFHPLVSLTTTIYDKLDYTQANFINWERVNYTWVSAFWEQCVLLLFPDFLSELVTVIKTVIEQRDWLDLLHTDLSNSQKKDKLPAGF